MMKIVSFAAGSNEHWALAEAASRAGADGKTLHLAFGESPSGGKWVKFKVGGGMWSAPMYSDLDAD